MHCKGAVITLEDSVKWGWQNEHFEHLDWCYSSVCGQSLLGWLWCGPGATEGAGRLWNLSFRRYLSIFSPIESEKNSPSFRFPTVQRCPAALLSFKRSTKCAFVLAWILHPILNFSNVLPFCFRCISIFSGFLILKDWNSSISTQSRLSDLQWICRAWTCSFFLINPTLLLCFVGPFHQRDRWDASWGTAPNTMLCWIASLCPRFKMGATSHVTCNEWVGWA